MSVMAGICRKVADLLRKHPILWLPYLAADLLSIGLWQLRGLAQKSIIHWFTTVNSVLGGNVSMPLHDNAALTRGFIAYLPIGITTIVTVVCLFVAALVATAAMVVAIERGQTPDGKTILVSLAADWRMMFLFALRFLITFAVFVGGLIALIFYLLFLTHRQDQLTSFWLQAGVLSVGVGLSSWLVMPSAICLLVGEAAVPVSTRVRYQGAMLAALTAEAGAVIGFFEPKLEASMLFGSQWEITALHVFNSVIANAPDVVLFVGLALLAIGLSQENDTKEGFKIHGLLSRLMPLHFGRDTEPPQIED
jgi:hypothetical protein